MCRCATFCAVLVALLAVAAYSTLSTAGALRTLRYHGDDRCTLLTSDKDHQGSEDIVVAREGKYAGLAFTHGDYRESWVIQTPVFPPIFSAPDAAGKMAASNHPVGSVYMVDMNTAPNAVVVRLALEGYPRPDFHPHGMELHHPVRDDGTRDVDALQLLLISHNRDGDSIDVFDVDVEARILRHTRSLSHTLLRRGVTNNLALARNGKDLYVTNWLYYPIGTMGNWIELFGQRSWATVVHCTLDPTWQCRVADSGLYMPNGIAVSNDDSRVYVGAAGTVRVYGRSSEDGSLELQRAVPVPTAVADNVDAHPSGDVTIGAHPNMFMFMAHAADHSTPAPSQVLRVRAAAWEGREADLNGEPAAEEPLLHDGTILSASAAAVEHGGWWLVGGVFGPGVMLCPSAAA